MLVPPRFFFNLHFEDRGLSVDKVLTRGWPGAPGQPARTIAPCRAARGRHFVARIREKVSIGIFF